MVSRSTSVKKQLCWLCVWRESAAFFGNQERTFHNQIIYSPLSIPQTGHGMLLHKQLSPWARAGFACRDALITGRIQYCMDSARCLCPAVGLLLGKERAVSGIAGFWLPHNQMKWSFFPHWSPGSQCPARPPLLCGHPLPCSASTTLGSVQTLYLSERWLLVLFFIYFFSILVLFLPGWWLLCSPSDGTPASPPAPIQLSFSNNSHCSPLLPKMLSASSIFVLLFSRIYIQPLSLILQPHNSNCVFSNAFEMSTHQVKRSLPFQEVLCTGFSPPRKKNSQFFWMKVSWLVGHWTAKEGKGMRVQAVPLPFCVILLAHKCII